LRDEKLKTFLRVKRVRASDGFKYSTFPTAAFDRWNARRKRRKRIWNINKIFPWK